MAINGRIKRPEATTNRLALPLIGKLKIGEKSPQGFPVSLDYFKPSGKYAGLFTQAYGEKPQTVQIVFPSDDPLQVCCEQYEYRNDAGDLLATGDGENFRVWDGKKYIEMNTEQTPRLMQSIASRYPTKEGKKQMQQMIANCSNADGGKNCPECGECALHPFGWRIKLTLNFIIPCVRGIAGIWRFETNGNASTIPNIREAFDAMLEQKGFCKGVIFDLNVQFAKTQKPGDKSRFPVVSLVPNQSRENMELIKEAYEPIKAIGNE